jgi:phosphate-selective porin OprO/OprP
MSCCQPVENQTLIISYKFLRKPFRRMVSCLILALMVPLGVISSCWASPWSWTNELIVEREERVESRRRTFQGYFDEGWWKKSQDMQFRYNFGGQLQTDQAFFSNDQAFESGFLDPGNSEFDVRRFRFYLEAGLYRKFYYKVEFDFGDELDIKDTFINMRKVPYFGTFQLGNFKEHYSLEGLVSSIYNTFMERSLMLVFATGRNFGVGAINQLLDQRMTWALGLFWPVEILSTPSAETNDGLIVSMRFTGLPWYQDEGERLFHVGFSYARLPSGSDIRFKTPPESNLAPPTIDTGKFDADGINRFNLEYAAVLNAFSFQAEVTVTQIEQPADRSDAIFGGFYIQGSYFLTGEHRPYSRAKGKFVGVKPKKSFLGKQEGWGAWEVAARYSLVDLNDSGISGGEEQNLTLGLNWHLNPLSKLMFNYIHADIERGPRLEDANLDIFQFRLQILF